jgi:hypothetical protein
MYGDLKTIPDGATVIRRQCSLINLKVRIGILTSEFSCANMVTIT